MQEVLAQVRKLPQTRSRFAATLLGTCDAVAFRRDPDRQTTEAAAVIVGELAARAEVVFLATIPVNIGQTRLWPDSKQMQRVRAYNAITRALAAEYDAVLIDLENVFLDEPHLFGIDGVHLNAIGQLRVAHQGIEALTARGYPLPDHELPPEPASFKGRQMIRLAASLRMLRRRSTVRDGTRGAPDLQNGPARIRLDLRDANDTDSVHQRGLRLQKH